MVFSPEGSYTDDANQEVRGPPQQHGHHSEFDDEFEDDDPLPAIGHCKAIYPFDGMMLDDDDVVYLLNILMASSLVCLPFPSPYLTSHPSPFLLRKGESSHGY